MNAIHKQILSSFKNVSEEKNLRFDLLHSFLSLWPSKFHFSKGQAVEEKMSDKSFGATENDKKKTTNPVAWASQIRSAVKRSTFEFVVA